MSFLCIIQLYMSMLENSSHVELCGIKRNVLFAHLSHKPPFLYYYEICRHHVDHSDKNSGNFKISNILKLWFSFIC